MQNFLKVKRTTLATRCEICHKADFYDSVKDVCLRCVDTLSPSNEGKKSKPSVLATERCKVFHPKEINVVSNICEYCSNLSIEAKKQDISEVRSKDWLKEVNTQYSSVNSYETLSLIFFVLALLAVFIGFFAYPFAMLLLAILLAIARKVVPKVFSFLRKTLNYLSVF